MGFNITDAAKQLQSDTSWQVLPEALSFDVYTDMVVYGIKRLFIDTGRALEFDNSIFYEAEDELLCEMNFAIDEEEYILLVAQIQFFKRVQLDANTAVSYSTDAMTVTQANKPYEHLQDTIEKLEARRRELYYRMVRYTLSYVTDDT